MKQRLAIINMALPLLSLAVLAFVSLPVLDIPQYIIFILVVLILGRALLLVQQQAVFTLIPVVFLVLPDSIDIGLNIHAPLASETLLIYLCVVNLQWGQRPWFHWLHCVNWLLLLGLGGLSQSLWVIPAEWWRPPIDWLAFGCILIPLTVSYWWGRPGRWSAYWPLVMVGLSLNQAMPDIYLHIWMALAALFSLTIDSYILAFVDELTGILGRRALMFKLKTQGNRYGLVMVDVDHFKAFNDKHGHQVGDDVLKTVAVIISETQGASAYRYGGEEFTLLFSGQSPAEIAPKVEATRERIAQYLLYPKRYSGSKKHRGQTARRKPLRITASFGLAMHRNGDSPDQVLERADKALYSAKANGRNQLVIAKS